MPFPYLPKCSKYICRDAPHPFLPGRTEVNHWNNSRFFSTQGQHQRNLATNFAKTHFHPPLISPYIFVVVAQSLSRVQLFVSPWTIIRQAPLSMGFPRQEYWSGLPFPTPGDCPNPGIKSASPALAGRFFTTKPPGKPLLLPSHNLPPLETQSLFPLSSHFSENVPFITFYFILEYS